MFLIVFILYRSVTMATIITSLYVNYLLLTYPDSKPIVTYIMKLRKHPSCDFDIDSLVIGYHIYQMSLYFCQATKW